MENESKSTQGTADNPWTDEMVTEFMNLSDGFDADDSVGELIAVIREEDGEEVRYDI